MGANSAQGRRWQEGFKVGSSAEQQWKKATEGGNRTRAGLYLEVCTGDGRGHQGWVVHVQE